MKDDVLKTLMAIAPEFDETPDIVLGVFYEIAESMVNIKAFGKKAQIALAYYIAHLITMHRITQEEGASSTTALGGAVVMEKEDELQRQYAAPSSSLSDSTLSATYYGRMSIELRNSCVFTAMTRLG